MCNFAESLQRQRFQSVNATAAIIMGLTYFYLGGRRSLPALATREMLAVLAVRAALLVMYYRHNARVYQDVRPDYAEHGRG